MKILTLLRDIKETRNKITDKEYTLQEMIKSKRPIHTIMLKSLELTMLEKRFYQLNNSLLAFLVIYMTLLLSILIIVFYIME